MAESSVRIEALQPEDVPAVAQLGADSFEVDRHTEMKSLGQEPYDHRQTMLDIVPGFLAHPRVVCLKAVDAESGEIMGYCNWGFKGFKPEEMPAVPGRTQPADQPKPAPSDETPDTSADKEKTKEEDGEEDKQPEKDPVKRLMAMTDADLNAWVEEVMPEGTRCLYVIMLSVSPKFQGRGVGSALLKWGTDRCEEHKVFAWVHSSEGAYGMYEKLGFQTIRSLDIDLDEYAPCLPPNEGPDAKWGHYVFRYMKYFPIHADGT